MQHVGLLFLTRFREARFIVVLLKDGPFTNANLYFARFRDGTSLVERTGQHSYSALYNHSEWERGEGAAGGAVAVSLCLILVLLLRLYSSPVVAEFRYLPTSIFL